MTVATLKTPVDTSRALSNWIATIGTKSNRSVLPYVHGAMGSTRGASSAAAIMAAQMVAEKSIPGVPNFVTNQVLYIGYINQTGGRMGEPNFFQSAVNAAKAEIKSAKLGLFNG